MCSLGDSDQEYRFSAGSFQVFPLHSPMACPSIVFAGNALSYLALFDDHPHRGGVLVCLDRLHGSPVDVREERALRPATYGTIVVSSHPYGAWSPPAGADDAKLVLRNLSTLARYEQHVSLRREPSEVALSRPPGPGHCCSEDQGNPGESPLRDLRPASVQSSDRNTSLPLTYILPPLALVLFGTFAFAQRGRYSTRVKPKGPPFHT